MNYYTDLGKKCNAIVNKYKPLRLYYDSMSGVIIIDLDTYNKNEEVSEAVFSLLQEPRFLDEKREEHNWALEIRSMDMGRGLKDYVILRTVLSYV